MNLLTEIAPQVMGQTGVAGVAIALPLATRGIYRLVDRIDHLSHLNATHVTRKLIAATRPANTGNQIATAQLGEQLLEIRQGDALPLGYIGQGNGTVLCVQRQIQHGGNGVTAFGSQSHGSTTNH